MAGTDIRAKISLDSSSFETGVARALGSLKNLAAFGGASLGVGMFASMTTGAFKSGEEIENLASRLQLTTNEAQQFQQVAQKVGVEVGAMAKAFKELKQAQTATQANSSGKEAEAFKRLGITIEEVRSLQPMELLKRVADGFNANSGSAQTMGDVLQVLGGKSDALLPVLAKLREELDKTRGRFLSPSEVKELAAADDVIDDAKIKGDLWWKRYVSAILKQAKENPLLLAQGFSSAAIFNKMAEAMADSGKPLASKTPTADTAAILANEKQLATLGEKNTKLLEARRLIGATADEEVALLQVEIDQLQMKRLGLDSDAERLALTAEIYAAENKVLAIKERQRVEQDRLTESIAENKRRANQQLLADSNRLAEGQDRLDRLAAEARIIGAADPEAQSIIEQTALVDKLKAKHQELVATFAEELKIQEAMADLMAAQNSLAEMQRRGAARPEARSFVQPGGVSLGATDSMREGIRGFDARLGGVNPRDLMGRMMGGVTGKPLDGVGSRTLTVQESIAKTAHDQLVALRQIAANVLKINTGATAQ